MRGLDLATVSMYIWSNVRKPAGNGRVADKAKGKSLELTSSAKGVLLLSCSYVHVFG